MGTMSVAAPPAPTRRLFLWLGALLTVVGLLGHVFAARAIGGTHLAYHDHIFGFFAIGAVTGVIIGGLGWRFWKGRPDITLLTFGAVQAIAGILIYIERFHVHG
jgi:hypothetical protein